MSISSLDGLFERTVAVVTCIGHNVGIRFEQGDKTNQQREYENRSFQLNIVEFFTHVKVR